MQTIPSAMYAIGFTIACLTAAPAVPARAQQTANDDLPLLQAAAGSEQLSTLVAAVKAAGLVELLGGKGPFTVFAPTDEAFASLPEGALADLLKPENKRQLQNIVKYHVAAGQHSAARLRRSESLKTVQGRELPVQQDRQGLQIDRARVIQSDIRCRNGVIHIIDAVILPRDK